MSRTVEIPSVQWKNGEAFIGSIRFGYMLDFGKAGVRYFTMLMGMGPFRYQIADTADEAIRAVETAADNFISDLQGGESK